MTNQLLGKKTAVGRYPLPRHHGFLHPDVPAHPDDVSGAGRDPALGVLDADTIAVGLRPVPSWPDRQKQPASCRGHGLYLAVQVDVAQLQAFSRLAQGQQAYPVLLSVFDTVGFIVQEEEWLAPPGPSPQAAAAKVRVSIPRMAEDSRRQAIFSLNWRRKKTRLDLIALLRSPILSCDRLLSTPG